MLILQHHIQQSSTIPLDSLTSEQKHCITWTYTPELQSIYRRRSGGRMWESCEWSLKWQKHLLVVGSKICPENTFNILQWILNFWWLNQTQNKRMEWMKELSESWLNMLSPLHVMHKTCLSTPVYTHTWWWAVHDRTETENDEIFNQPLTSLPHV